MLKCKGKLYIYFALFFEFSGLTLLISQTYADQSKSSTVLQVSNFESDLHQYHLKSPEDPFAPLVTKMQQKRPQALQFETEKDALRALLIELEVSEATQVLVFSNTSLQLSRISKNHPRALFFNDDLYVGYVPGGFIEIIGIDPKVGAIPYVFRLPKRGDNIHPPIRRSSRCMRCHATSSTAHIPGLLMSSVIPAEGGGSLDNLAPEQPGHEIPYGNRFGGWFLSDRNSKVAKWSNSTGIMTNGNISQQLVPWPHQNIAKYHLNDKSETVAHLILSHQVGFTNLCIEIQYLLREFKEKYPHDYEKKITGKLVEKLLSYALFSSEPRLPISLSKENSLFVDEFESLKHSNKKFHEFRKLNLRDRLLEIRCSYMLGSNVYQALPKMFKSNFEKTLVTILKDEHGLKTKVTDHLESSEKAKILEILEKYI